MTPLTEYDITEPHFSLSQAAKRIHRDNNKKVDVSTFWRWCRKGVRGVYLEYRKIGRSIVVSDSGLNRFFMALAQADLDNQAPAVATRKRKPRRRPNSAARQREIDSANDILRRAGILTDADAHEPASFRSGGV